MDEVEKQSTRESLERMLKEPTVRVMRARPVRETKSYEKDEMRGESEAVQTRYLIIAVGPKPADKREDKVCELLAAFA